MRTNGMFHDGWSLSIDFNPPSGYDELQKRYRIFEETKRQVDGGIKRKNIQCIYPVAPGRYTCLVLSARSHQTSRSSWSTRSISNSHTLSLDIHLNSCVCFITQSIYQRGGIAKDHQVTTFIQWTVTDEPTTSLWLCQKCTPKCLKEQSMLYLLRIVSNLNTASCQRSISIPISEGWFCLYLSRFLALAKPSLLAVLYHLWKRCNIWVHGQVVEHGVSTPSRRQRRRGKGEGKKSKIRNLKIQKAPQLIIE